MSRFTAFKALDVPRLGLRLRPRWTGLSVHFVPCLVVCLAFLVMNEAIPQDRDPPSHAVDGSYVREWLVLGPFSSKTFDVDFLEESGGESGARPREGDTVMRNDGTLLTWTRMSSEIDQVNLERVFGVQTWSFAYAYCELLSDREFLCEVRFPNSDYRSWINGVQTESVPVDTMENRNHLRTQPVPLRSGTNRMLMKLNVQVGEWVFSVQPLPRECAVLELKVRDVDGVPLPSALAQIYVQGRETWRMPADASGRARISLFPPAQSYDVRITSGKLGAWMCDIRLRPGETQFHDLQLAEANALSGRTQAMDSTPQTAVVVQALHLADSEKDEGLVDLNASMAVGAGGIVKSGWDSDRLTLTPSLIPTPAFSETTLSDTNGVYRFQNLKPGSYLVRCHGRDGFEYVSSRRDDGEASKIALDADQVLEGIDFVFQNSKKGVWRTIPVTKGFTELNPLSVHRTPDGLLWVGTDDGILLAYDGSDFISRFQTSGSHVEVLDSDPSGRLWVATNNGLEWMRGNQLIPLSTGEGTRRFDTRSLEIGPDGEVYVGTGLGLVTIDQGERTILGRTEGLPGNSVTSVLRVRDGSIWLGTGMGLVQVQNGHISMPLSFEGYVTMNIRRMIQSRDGAIWFCNSNFHQGGVYRFDGVNLHHLGMTDGLPHPSVFDIAETSDGILWFATGMGLSRFNGVSLVNYTMDDGLSNSWVRDLFVDEDDVIWMATGLRLSRFDPKALLSFDRRDGMISTTGNTPGVFEFEPDMEGGFWVGTEWAGVFHIQAGDHPKLDRALPDKRYVRQIRQMPDGTVYLGVSDGAYKLTGEAFSKVFTCNWVIALEIDPLGRLWFGHGWNGGGVTLFDPATGLESAISTLHGLPDEHVWSIENNPDGGVWIGTASGLILADKEGFALEKNRVLLPNEAVFDLRHDDSGALWIATSKGLYQFVNNRLNPASENNLNLDGSNWCSTRTSDGTVWIGTAHFGLIGFDGKTFTQLDKRDGLLGNSVMTISHETDGDMWLGFQEGGISRYKRGDSRPSVHLVGLVLDDQVITDFSRPTTTETGNRVTIQYREVDLKTHPDKRQFHYKLVDASRNTLVSGVTQQRSFDWIAEAQGEYRFEVQAVDRDLCYSRPARVSIHVVLPWHNNPWFTVPGMLAASGLLIWAFVARKLYSMKRRDADRMRERARIAQDLHDQLGAGLTHIAMLGDILRQKSDQSGTVQSLSTQLSESAYDLSRTMGQVIWATDPTKDTLKSFISFVSSYVEKFFLGADIRIRYDFPKVIPQEFLQAPVRYGLFLVIKEALNNVLKHANASQVTLKLELLSEHLLFSVEDNGLGFDPGKVSAENHGLKNMAKRVQDLGGEFRIDARANQGTRIKVSMPFPAS